MRRLAAAVLLLGACIVPGMETFSGVNGRGGTLSYRGRNVRPDILAERRAEALQLATDFCDGGFHLTAERQEGFNENLLNFRCGEEPYSLGPQPPEPAPELGYRRIVPRVPQREVQPAVEVAVEERQLPHLSIEVTPAPKLGELTAQNSHRSGSRYWEFILSYRNTAAAVADARVECMTVHDGHVLNAERSTERRIAPDAYVIFKVAVEDAGEIATSAVCRLLPP